MRVRATLLLVFGCVLFAGCSQNEPLASGLAGTAQAAEVERDPATKTMASRMLSAIALERITGRKPDPLRFGMN